MKLHPHHSAAVSAGAGSDGILLNSIPRQKPRTRLLQIAQNPVQLSSRRELILERARPQIPSKLLKPLNHLIQGAVQVVAVR